MQEVQLYIDGQRVELFNDEKISLTQTIQNIKDISKVFTDFSKQFNLPASRNNNKIFKHYYNADIVDGFDARKRVDALIKLNGLDFKKGKIRLDSVSLKNNVANSYKVVFFGEIVSLSDLLGEDKIDELDLFYLNHNYDVITVLEGLESYVHKSSRSTIDDLPVGAITYPLISREQRYTYENLQVAGNIKYTSSGQSNGVNYEDLKPAIRCFEIIEAIEEKYDLSFSRDFLNKASHPFKDLYLWMNRTKGVVGAKEGDEEIYRTSVPYGFNYASGDGDFVDFTSNNKYWSAQTDSETYWDGRLEITPSNTNNYDIRIEDLVSGSVLLEEKENSGTKNFHINLPRSNYIGKNYKIKVTVSTLDVSSYAAKWIISKIVDDIEGGGTDETSTYITNSISFISEVIMSDNMPKIKVIDFLTGIFKLYNLTAYVDDGVVIVKSLDDYYSNGVEREITKYVDINTLDVSRSSIYKEISFKYEEPKTFLIQNANKLNNDDFGNLDYTDENIDGGKYEIKVPFEHMMYERLISGVQYGYFVNEKQEPDVGNPLLFYNVSTTTSNPIAYLNTTTESVSTYNRPSNTIATSTLNFGSEIDEFTLTTDDNSLFNNYYSNYILSVFDVKSRIYKFKVFLPLSFLLNYSLADTLIIDGKKYRINSINSNLQTGESKLELIKSDLTILDVPDTEAPTVPTNLVVSSEDSTSFNLAWDASTDNVGVQNYDVYIGSVYYNTTSNLNLNVTGLTPSTTYSAQVLARDLNNNVSDLSTSVNGTTIADSSNPTLPTNLTVRLEAPGSAADILVNWDDSYDADGIDYYNVYRNTNGGSYTIIATPSISFFSDTTPMPNNTYCYKVEAIDNQANSSGLTSEQCETP